MSKTAVEDSPTSLQKEITRNTDNSFLGNHGERIISVTRPLSSPSKLATETSKKKASPMNNNDLKKNGLNDTDNDPSIQVSTVHQVTSSPPLEGVPPVQASSLTARFSKVRPADIRDKQGRRQSY